MGRHPQETRARLGLIRPATILVAGISLVACLSSQAAESTSDPQAQAVALFAQGKFKAAAESYRAILSQSESDLRNRFLLASLLFEQDQFLAAHTQFAAIHQANPNAQGAAALATLPIPSIATSAVKNLLTPEN
jgi:tetratricopeptide (TPR) repeat protein